MDQQYKPGQNDTIKAKNRRDAADPMRVTLRNMSAETKRRAKRIPVTLPSIKGAS